MGRGFKVCDENEECYIFGTGDRPDLIVIKGKNGFTIEIKISKVAKSLFMGKWQVMGATSVNSDWFENSRQKY